MDREGYRIPMACRAGRDGSLPRSSRRWRSLERGDEGRASCLRLCANGSRRSGDREDCPGPDAAGPAREWMQPVRLLDSRLAAQMGDDRLDFFAAQSSRVFAKGRHPPPGAAQPDRALQEPVARRGEEVGVADGRHRRRAGESPPLPRVAMARGAKRAEQRGSVRAEFPLAEP